MALHPTHFIILQLLTLDMNQSLLLKKKMVKNETVSDDKKNLIRIGSVEWEELIDKLTAIRQKSNRDLLCTKCW